MARGPPSKDKNLTPSCPLSLAPRVQMMQANMRRDWRASLDASASYNQQLTVGEKIGSGGFGTVRKGIWHRMPCAVKVRGLFRQAWAKQLKLFGGGGAVEACAALVRRRRICKGAMWSHTVHRLPSRHLKGCVPSSAPFRS